MFTETEHALKDAGTEISIKWPCKPHGDDGCYIDADPANPHIRLNKFRRRQWAAYNVSRAITLSLI